MPQRQPGGCNLDSRLGDGSGLVAFDQRVQIRQKIVVFGVIALAGLNRGLDRAGVVALAVSACGGTPPTDNPAPTESTTTESTTTETGIGTKVAFNSITMPGAYVCDSTGHLVRISDRRVSRRRRWS